MAHPVDRTGGSAQQRAQAIISAARAELSGRLWRAAIGNADDNADANAIGRIWTPSPLDGLSGMRAPLPAGIDALLRMTQELEPPPAPVPASGPAAQAAPGRTASASEAAPLPDFPVGPNHAFAAALDAAAARTGIPASALTAIVDAEAARTRNGAWNPLSRNSRSSAAGLGQFLTGTWLTLARQPGSWLYRTAQARGLIDSEGKVVRGARSALLTLRYDPAAAIESIADYARTNLGRLRTAGVAVGEGASDVARAAYIAHHLGPGDAVRFYRGGLDDDRARALLAAQIGDDRAARRIADAGGAARAHRAWLLAYVGRHTGGSARAAPRSQDIG